MILTSIGTLAGQAQRQAMVQAARHPITGRQMRKPSRRPRGEAFRERQRAATLRARELRRLAAQKAQMAKRMIAPPVDIRGRIPAQVSLTQTGEVMPTAIVGTALAAGQSLLRAGTQFLGTPTGRALVGAIAPGMAPRGAAGPTGAQRVYSAAFVRDGKVYVQTQSGWRVIGYTHSGAKKKYKKRRRRARLTQKDKYEWEMRLAIAQTQAGKPALPPVG